MARKAGVSGWHGMRKDDLIAALLSPELRPKADNGRAKRQIREKLAEINRRRAAERDLTTDGESASDRLVVLVRDPYWLHAHWELSAQGVERARRALGVHWHSAAPTLRLHRLNDDGTTRDVRAIAVHGGVSNWYIDVADPPARFRAEIGYGSDGGDFYCLARSNEITTPAPGVSDSIDENWKDVARNADRVYALSGGYTANGASAELQELLESRLRRRLGRPSETRYGHGAAQRSVEADRRLEVEAEIVVHGAADPRAHVTVLGEPVSVAADGRFVVRLPFPNRRQVIPVVANTSDGVDQQTVILGVERNTKHLEQRPRDPAAG